MYWPILLSLGLGGSIIGAFWMVIDWVVDKIKSNISCSVTLKSADETFKWTLKFMIDKGFLTDESNLRGGIEKASDKPWWESMFEKKDAKAKPKIEFNPGPGTQIFYYKNQRFYFELIEEKTILTGW
jgi:hypothetical protein